MAVDVCRAVRALPVVCLLALVGGSAAVAAGGSASAVRGSAPDASAPTPGDYSVTLEQCVGSGLQAERSATFAAQMVATAATQKMAMKIQLEERPRGDAEYHVVTAPGLGVWKPSEAAVKIYKYVKQVTNLPAPAFYRADVKFRWIGAKGRVIKRAELRSSRCFQPPLSVAAPGPVPAG